MNLVTSVYACKPKTDIKSSVCVENIDLFHQSFMYNVEFDTCVHWSQLWLAQWDKIIKINCGVEVVTESVVVEIY